MNGQKTCPTCNKNLSYPYIRCMECVAPPLDLCLSCFARGVEKDGHHSDHKYAVIVSILQLSEYSRAIFCNDAGYEMYNTIKINNLLANSKITCQNQ